MMASCKLALIVSNPSNSEEFLVVKQSRPPKFGDEEYDSFADSDLWDLPSVELKPLDFGRESRSTFELQGVELFPDDKLNLREFDVKSALLTAAEQIGLQTSGGNEQWKLFKYVEEPEFGPGSPVHTAFVSVSGQPSLTDENDQGASQWMSKQQCFDWLLEVKKGSDRIGPLVVIGLLNDSFSQSVKLDLPQTLRSQEYPPGIVLVPMDSGSLKPFRTTNLIVFAPRNMPSKCEDNQFVASGNALIVDPGCLSRLHQELADIVAALPKKLIVFVTHHHHDHVGGLSVVQKYNPDAILLAHENTMRRIKKGDWSNGYTSISGDEEIYVGGQTLRVINAPGHTDGHMGLLHISTNSLIVGDHCVGEGSAVLDGNSGGNMADYFRVTYGFIEFSPHVIIPTHGRVNMWPKHMLCSYLKNRRSRESSILRAIENGANTLFDIVATVYSSVDPSLWFAASWNVRLHIDHLALQQKLPQSFSMEEFQKSRGLRFLIRFMWTYSRSRFTPRLVVDNKKLSLAAAVAVASFSAMSLYRKGSLR